MNSRTCLLTGALLMATGVVFGAFGAHILQDLLPGDRYAIFQTAVEYHFYHALGLLLTGGLSRGVDVQNSIWHRRAGTLFTAGILLFSGSLYALVLTGYNWLGAVTPLGGITFIAGWIALAIGIRKQPS